MCTCTEYVPIEFTRSAVSGRLKASRSLRKSLSLIAKHGDGEHKLYSCEACGQLWQGSRAWNWGNDEYLFRVPGIELSEWLKEVFVQPDELLIYVARMAEFLKISFAEGESDCRIGGCKQKAVQGLATCLPHHIESLQDMGRFPQEPVGRWFEPYLRAQIVPKL